jgi:hypothetical protein
MTTRAHIAFAGLGIALAANAAGAQEALRLRAGEHPSFTRLVLDAPAGTAFEWGVEGRTLTLFLPGQGGAIDAAPARQVRGLSRVGVLQGIASPGGAALRVALTCDCGARTTRLADGRIVIDIAASAPRPAPPALEMPPAPGTDIATVPTTADGEIVVAAAPPALPARTAPGPARPQARPAAQRPATPPEAVAATERATAQAESARPAAADRAAEPAGDAATAPAAPDVAAVTRETPASEAARAEPAHETPAHDAPARPAPDPVPQEAHAAPAQATENAVAPHPDPTARATPQAAPPPAAPGAEAPAIPHAPIDPATIEAARDRLLAQLTKAAEQGLLTLSDQPETPPAPAPAAEEAGAHEAAAPAHAEADAAQSPKAPAAPEPQLQVRTAIDIAQGDSRARPPAETPDIICIPDSALDIGSWSTDAPFSDQLGERRRALVGEFDEANPDAVIGYAKFMLSFGLGVEARNALETFGATVAPPAMLMDMAAVVDGDASSPVGALRAGLGCPGFHGLWAAASAALAGDLDGATVDPDALRLSLSMTPPRLRARLAIPVAAAALEAGRITEAEILAGLAARAEPPAPDGDAMLTVLMARIDAARGEWRRAEPALEELTKKTSPAGIEAMIRLVEIRLARGLSTPTGLAENMEAIAYSQGASPTGRRLLGAAAQARAAGEGLAPALAALAALARRADDPTAAQAAARTILIDYQPEASQAAAYADGVLKYWSLVGDDAGGDPARVAVARRLVAFGLDNIAEDLLTPALARGDAPARLLAAESAMATRPGHALSLLADLPGPEAALLRAQALSALGRHSDAAAEAVRTGDADLAARYAWLAGNWSAAAAAGKLDRRILAAWMSGATEMPEELRKAAAADPAQADLVAAFPSPPPATEPTPIEAAQTALEASKRRRAIMGGLLGDG